LFTAVSEYFFWSEFNTRFNFIAVDYLIYTTEVIGNIQQSYPINYILTGIIILAILIYFIVRTKIIHKEATPLRLSQRSPVFILSLGIPLLSYFFIDTRLHHFSDNTFSNELAGNGMYELFAAYKNNSLDYDQFYPHIADSIALKRIQQKFPENYIRTGNSHASIQHEVKSNYPEKKMNVVLISVESLSAEFMALFGNDKNITPFLDSMAHHSMVFTNLYATGTRTVRGLEALSLSVPPTPGQSIVRRPENEHLFTLASVFNEKGYDCKYIYGGYGYFDNMNYFFENNGYQVIDRNALAQDEIDYENIWGVADENLFSLSIKEIDESVTKGKTVFTHIMTTSNHRPFTYPEGRINIPSHTGREGAVKYTDFSIAQFIKKASKKTWYKNTVFIVTADHCASTAGKTELPLKKYQIPLLIFSPSNISPQIQNRLMSQIDIAPTLLGLLNFSYSSKFFGYDINNTKAGDERAFISTYQSLGFIEHDSMVLLSPRKSPEVMIVNKQREQIAVLVDPEKSQVVKDAISWYQTASYSFKNGLMKQ
jgi:phosphoglycerol transferase MdoB-like AlkP superfamily enzyme